MFQTLSEKHPTFFSTSGRTNRASFFGNSLVIGILSVLVFSIWFGIFGTIFTNIPQSVIKKNEAFIVFILIALIPILWVSRPEGFHLKPLAEPDMTLSSHPAPIIQPGT